MSIKMKAVPLEDSDDDIALDGEDGGEIVRKRIKLVSDSNKLEERNHKFSGGIVFNSELETKDPSTSASLSAAEKKRKKEVEELDRELDLKNTFSRETNRRDEDAEMNKYIDEQIRLRREAAKKERDEKLKDRKALEQTTKPSDELEGMFTLPATAIDKLDDILLHSLSKHLSSASDEKSEAMLSSQMLNGIPEIDLGITERIRTIEATEEAKIKLATSNTSRNASSSHRGHSKSNLSGAPVNFSSNFRQHRTKETQNNHKIDNNNASNIKTVTEAVVVVGEEPDEIEYRLPSSSGERLPPRGKASDDYYLSKFKKNNRK